VGGFPDIRHGGETSACRGIAPRHGGAKPPVFRFTERIASFSGSLYGSVVSARKPRMGGIIAYGRCLMIVAALAATSGCASAGPSGAILRPEHLDPWRAAGVTPTASSIEYALYEGSHDADVEQCPFHRATCTWRRSGAQPKARARLTARPRQVHVRGGLPESLPPSASPKPSPATIGCAPAARAISHPWGTSPRPGTLGDRLVWPWCPQNRASAGLQKGQRRAGRRRVAHAHAPDGAGTPPPLRSVGRGRPPSYISEDAADLRRRARGNASLRLASLDRRRAAPQVFRRCGAELRRAQLRRGGAGAERVEGHLTALNLAAESDSGPRP
jgi:hypothetical protein